MRNKRTKRDHLSHITTVLEALHAQEPDRRFWAVTELCTIFKGLESHILSQFYDFYATAEFVYGDKITQDDFHRVFVNAMITAAEKYSPGKDDRDWDPEHECKAFYAFIGLHTRGEIRAYLCKQHNVSKHYTNYLVRMKTRGLDLWLSDLEKLCEVIIDPKNNNRHARPENAARTIWRMRQKFRNPYKGLPGYEAFEVQWKALDEQFAPKQDNAPVGEDDVFTDNLRNTALSTEYRRLACKLYAMGINVFTASEVEISTAIMMVRKKPELTFNNLMQGIGRTAVYQPYAYTGQDYSEATATTGRSCWSALRKKVKAPAKDGDGRNWWPKTLYFDTDEIF